MNRIAGFFVVALALIATACTSNQKKDPNEEVVRGKYTSLPSTLQGDVYTQVRKRTKELSADNLKPCYDAKLVEKPGDPLQVRMAWTINSGGQVVKPTAAPGTDPKLEGVTNCVAKQMDNWMFINNSFQDVEVVLPMSITQ
jgi:hypothetical protein